MPMKKILSIFAVAVLSLFAGEAFAQRNLHGMSAVEVRADMVNGFYTGNSRNCGYNLGVFYSIIKGNNANTWSFGGEYLQTYKPYGEKGRIPVAQFTGEVGYNLRIVSARRHFISTAVCWHLQATRRSTGARASYATARPFRQKTLSSMALQSLCRPISISRIMLHSVPI